MYSGRVRRHGSTCRSYVSVAIKSWCNCVERFEVTICFVPRLGREGRVFSQNVPGTIPGII